MKLNRSQSKNVSPFKLTDMIKKEQQMQMDATQKYNRFKKSASLPAYYINHARLKKITSIYRSLTADKVRTHSTSKSQRQSNVHLIEKKGQQNHPFVQSSLNTFLGRDGKPKQKLTLQRGTENKPPSKDGNEDYMRLLVKIKGYSLKLRDLSEKKSEDRFLQEFKVLCEMIFHPHYDIRQTEQIRSCLMYLEKCCAKREGLKIAEVKKKYEDFEKEFSNMQIELKKKTIKAFLTDKQIINYQSKVRETEDELNKLKAHLNAKKVEIGVGTSFHSISTIKEPNDSDSEQNIFLPTQYYNLTNTNFYQNSQNNDHQCLCSQLLEENNKKLEEYSKRIHSYNQRQKEMLSVMVVLQRQGVDIEKIYSQVVNGKIEVQEEESQMFGKHATEVRKQQSDIYKRCKDVKINSSVDADNSIVSDEEGLSFNYEDKSQEQEVYTVRNEYKCQQDLGEAMKNRLKLNFNILYEDADVYTGDFESGESDPPTI